MASEYSVNISLDTKKAESGLKRLRTQINDLNKPTRTTKTTRQEEKIAKLKEAQRVSMVQTRQIGDQVQKAADSGLKVDKARAAIRRAAKADSAGLVKLSEVQRKAALQELSVQRKITEQLEKQKAASVLTGFGPKSPVFGRATQMSSAGNIASILQDPTTSASPVQQALAKMEERSAKNTKQAVLNRKKSLSLGKSIVSIKTKEANLDRNRAESLVKETQIAQNRERLQANRLLLNESTAQGDFSRLSDRQSRNREGGRTFMNNPLGRRGIRPTRGFDTQSALISGAFPLLFGQGPIGAVAGGLGGGIGGMFGQMGGFAGGIAATAVVQQIQSAVAAVSQLGQAFNSINPNIEALTASLGVAGTEEERRLKLIEETQGKQAALAAVTENMNKAIGVDGVENLKKFGETSQLLANAFTLAMTKMQAALAPFFELLATPFAGQLKAQQRAEQVAAGGGATDATLLGLQEELAGISGNRQNRARRKRLEAQIEARKEELAELGKIEITAKNIRMIEDSKLKKIRQQNDLLRAKINGNFEEVQLAQEVEEKIQEMVEAGAKINEIDKQRVEDTMKLNKDLEKQAELAEKIRQSFKDLGQSIATDISDGIQGMIRGTSTLNNMLNNVLDKLIDAAFNMAMFGNMQGSLGGGGLIGSIFGGIGSMFGGKTDTTFGTGIPSGANLKKGSFGISTIKREAGGPVRGGSGYLVGERGPEMFTPGVSGMITPNHALGGSTNIVVNVDASGSSVEGDEEQGRELGKLISVAIQSELVKQKRPGGLLG